MTLDEAIQILERKVDTCLKLIKQLKNDDSISAVMHLENESQKYEEYHLLVEWLKELKAYRELVDNPKELEKILNNLVV